MSVFKIVVIVVLVLAAGGYALYRYISSPSGIASLMRDNINNYSIVFAKNDSLLINKNANVMRPLASTMKVIIAIEFAEQVAAGKLQADEQVPLAELEKYYIKHTDGGAHTKWLQYVDEHKQQHDGMVQLWHVAFGMMRFSSNADTEFMMDKLGLDNINNRIALLGLPHHQPLFYAVSSLFITDDIDQLPGEDLQERCAALHTQVKNGTIDTALIERAKRLDIPTQKKWSNRLPAATAAEYHTLMSRINKKDYFSPAAQHELDRLMEWPTERTKGWATKIGGKGGSTLWILNNAIYMQDLQGNRYEFIMFSNTDKDNNDNFLIGKAMPRFLKTLFTGGSAANSIISKLNNAK